MTTRPAIIDALTLDVRTEAHANPAAPSSVWQHAGEWAFKQRSWLPVPIALVLLLVQVGKTDGDAPVAIGMLIVAGGEIVRLWTVRHIGVISRTRSTRWGPLVVSGPYRLVRNPIYVGNWLIWTGFTTWSALLWMLPVAWVIFALQYAAIVQWEEQRLLAHFGQPYGEYLKAVPRWFPRQASEIGPATPVVPHAWSAVLFSERGTLGAIGLMALLLTLSRALL